MEYFPCYSLPLLDGLEGLSDDAQLVYVKALLIIYHRNGSFPAEVLRTRFHRWRPHRLQRALGELISHGKLFGTAKGYLHNERAMHEIAQLGEISTAKAKGGREGGRRKAKADRLARSIAMRNASPDLFDKPAETPLNGPSIAVEQPLSDDRSDFEIPQPTHETGNINDLGLAEPCYARAGIKTKTKTIPPAPFDDDDEDPPVTERRKPRRRLPADWTPPPVTDLPERYQTLVSGWPDGSYEIEAEKFANHAPNRTCADWTRAFYNWLLTAEQIYQRHAPREQQKESYLDICRRELAEQRHQHG